jgi:hypothetical protein
MTLVVLTSIFLAISLIGVDMASDVGVISSMVTFAWDMKIFEHGLNELAADLKSCDDDMGHASAWHWHGVDCSAPGKEVVRKTLEDTAAVIEWAKGNTILSICVISLSLLALVRFSPLPGMLHNAASTFSMASPKLEQGNTPIPLGKLILVSHYTEASLSC